ncbi:MAG: hypothetical protein ACREEA_10575 [Stellaceae bacterium]
MDRAAGEAFVAAEPSCNAGLYRTIKIGRMRKGQRYPDNAPEAPEGV